MATQFSRFGPILLGVVAIAGVGLGEDHHVLGLHVAVDHPALVRVVERIAQRQPDAGDVAVGQRARLGQLGEGSAPNQLRHEVCRVLVVVELVEAHHARVVEPRRGLRLALGPQTVIDRSSP